MKTVLIARQSHQSPIFYFALINNEIFLFIVHFKCRQAQTKKAYKLIFIGGRRPDVEKVRCEMRWDVHCEANKFNGPMNDWDDWVSYSILLSAHFYSTWLFLLTHFWQCRFAFRERILKLRNILILVSLIIIDFAIIWFLHRWNENRNEKFIHISLVKMYLFFFSIPSVVLFVSEYKKRRTCVVKWTANQIPIVY